jgi:2-polyprenyl-6-methoxyphenol hydroxylase-like FAD-dependent oxidoreductase
VCFSGQVTTPRIAIVGGGLGGLACARVLHQHGRPVTVFEREPGPGSRAQGGTLDMHADSGQLALREAGLFDRFTALARPEGQEWRSTDHHGTLLGRRLPEDGADSRPEIDRGQLRGLYLDGLPAGTVRWDRSVTGVTPLPDGTARAGFADGASADFDLVIGADGAWSRVRPAISPATPEYTGVTFVETGFDDVDHRHPAVAALVGNGTLVAKGPGAGIAHVSVFAQRNSNGRVRTYVAFRAPEDWHRIAGLDVTDPVAARAHLLGLLDGWADELRGLVRDSDDGFVNRPLFVLPVPHTWTHVPGVTLLGDAAHLMPPLGVGANLAMLDGTELARAIVTEPDLDSAVRAYERVMLPRSAEIAAECADGLRRLMPPEHASVGTE